MKYVALVYSNPATWAHPLYLHQDDQLTPDQRRELDNRFSDLLRQITASGELIGGGMLADPSLATFIYSGSDGSTQVVDGPFTEFKEHLAGYFLLDCETPHRAREIAVQIPANGQTTVELRPLMAGDGPEI